MPQKEVTALEKKKFTENATLSEFESTRRIG